jgi:acetolactate synthase-1/2/3 large subunit
MEFASMGWAIAASVGAALARRDQPVVCITGDGSLLMSGQEMTVALQHRLPIVYLILNDGALGMVKHGQRLARAEAVGFELPPIDFAAMARAMGVRGFRISCPADLEALDIEALLAGDGPVLLDVKIDPEEVPPNALRVSVLND